MHMILFSPVVAIVLTPCRLSRPRRADERREAFTAGAASATFIRWGGNRIQSTKESMSPVVLDTSIYRK